MGISEQMSSLRASAHKRIRYDALLPGNLSFEMVTYLVGVLIAFGFGALVIGVQRVNPLQAYGIMVTGAFGSPFAISETLVKTVPLLFVALGLSVAFRASFWNMGAEGQLYVGGTVAALVGIYFARTPGVFALVFVASFIAGGLWALVPALLKIKLGVNEIVTSLMMNFIATYLVHYLVNGPFREPSSVFPITPYIGDAARLPPIFAGYRIHYGLVIAIIATVATYIFLNKTTLGYRIRGVGLNPTAAKHAGIGILKTVAIAAIISGGLAGLAGMNEVTGNQYRMTMDISPGQHGYGYDGIAIALMGAMSPIAVSIVSVLFAGLMTGADAMLRHMGVYSAFVRVFEGLIIIVVLSTVALMRTRKRTS